VSQLAEMFTDNSTISIIDEGNIYIDREATVFSHAIDYLGSDINNLLQSELTISNSKSIQNFIKNQLTLGRCWDP